MSDEAVDLGAENARLRQELEWANERQANLRQEFQSFVYAVSHDLKEALRNIGSYSQLLIRSAPSDESTKAYSDFILAGIRSASTLIDQLTTLSRAGSSPQRSTINLSACVHTALYKLNDEVRRTGAKISVKELPEITVNQADFDQVFEKLIDNAIKYAGKQAAPEIEIGFEDGEGVAVVYVRDHGPGIPERFLNEVFQPFKRLHTREIPGTGLGLALCRKIVEAHGGQVWAESDGSSGTTMRMRLPY